MGKKKLLIGLGLSLFLLVASCGSGSSSLGETSGTVSGQIFLDDGASKPLDGTAETYYSVSQLEGITVHLTMDGVVEGETTTDSYGRFHYTDVVPGSYQVHIEDSEMEIDGSYSFDFSEHEDVSLYCMLYEDGSQINGEWTHEFSDEWENMPHNFDGMMDENENDMERFWDENEHQWSGLDAGMMMNVM